MPTLVVVILIVLMVCWLLVAWVVLAGDREQDIVDEEPTLNTRNDE